MKVIREGIVTALVFIMSLTSGCGNKNTTTEADSDSIRNTAVEEVSESQIETPKSPVEIVDTCNLRIYYPNYSKIDLVCGTMPLKDNDSVILVCAAAYTLKYLEHFAHSNIVGNHVSGGRLYNGDASDAPYRGAFSFYDGKPHFAYDNWNRDFHEASSKGGCGFAQDMMIHDGGIVKHFRSKNDEDIFRALCLIDDKLAVTDAKEKISFGDFIQNLINVGASEAIYLDMGKLKHSWYRDEEGTAVDIFPNPTKSGTNWITFYK